MTIEGDAQQKIQAYLDRLRRSLRGLSQEEIREIVEELRSHILDKASADGEVTAAGVDAALAALGSPEALSSRVCQLTPCWPEPRSAGRRSGFSAEPVSMGQPECCRIFRPACIDHWIRNRNQFLPRRPLETVSSRHGRLVGLARQW